MSGTLGTTGHQRAGFSWDYVRSRHKFSTFSHFLNILLIKVPFEASLLNEAPVGVEGHSLVERVCIKMQQSI